MRLNLRVQQIELVFELAKGFVIDLILVAEIEDYGTLYGAKLMRHGEETSVVLGIVVGSSVLCRPAG